MKFTTPIMRLSYLMLLVATFFLFRTAGAQRLVGMDTLYGNEWISQQEYLKLKVTTSGIYKVSQTELNALGWDNLAGAELKLNFLGQEQKLYVSNNGNWTTSDYLFFYASSDEFSAYEDEVFLSGPGANLNPNQKLFSDTVVYYLSREQGAHLRYTEKQPVAAIPSILDSSLQVSQLPNQNPALFHSRKENAFGSQSSQFENGDGWVYNVSYTVPLTFSHVGLDGNNDIMFSSSLFSSTYNPAGIQRQREIVVNNISIFSENTSPNQRYEDELVLQPNQLSAGSSTLVRINGLANTSDRYAVGQSVLKYHRLTSSFESNIAWETGGLVKSIRWDNVQQGAGFFYVFDIERGIIQKVSPSMPYSDIALSQTNQIGVAAYFDDALSPNLELISVENLNPALAADYLIVSSRKMNSWNSNAKNYADFRSNSMHGGYNVAILQVEDLIDQFGYGVPNDPRALRNAFSYFANVGNAKRALLLGKGRTFNGVRFPQQLANPDNASFYIPSYGVPASDNLLAFNPLKKEMSLSIGRLSVQNADHIDIMIEKYSAEAEVRALPQSILDRFWTKQTVIISGGKEPTEQAFLKNYLVGFSDVLQNGDLGVEYTGLHKTTTEPIQLTASEAYYDRVNKGVSLISFFGHAAATTLDVSVDDFERYRNEGKYPLFVGLGCYAGDANSPSESLSESFVFEPRKSMSGFLASIGLSYPGATANFTTQFYSNLTEEYFGLPISDALTDVLSSSLNSLSFQTRNFAEQLVYQGDPAARLFVADGVDLIVNEAEIKVGPNPLTSVLDSFEVSIEVLNLGRTDTAAFEIEWERKIISTGEILKDTLTVTNGVAARKKITFNIPSLYLEGEGLNEISFNLLPRTQQNPEAAAEANDKSGVYQFFVASSVVKILWPHENSIVPQEDLRMFVEYGSPWDEDVTFQVQVSVDESFTFIQEDETIDSKSLLEYRLNGNYVAGTILHTRVKLSTDSIWTYRSFQIGEASGVHGRNLNSVNQFNQGVTNELRPTSTGEWQFGREQFIKVLTTKQYDRLDPPTFERNLDNPYISVVPWNFLDAGLSILVADSLTGDEIYNNPPQYGSINCGSPNRAFAFRTETPAQRALVVDFLNTVPQDGEFVYVFTIYRDTTSLNPADWALDTARGFSESIPSVLRKLGANQISNWVSRGTVPYNFIYRHRSGFSSEVLDERLGSSREDVIVSTVALPLRRRFGDYQSPYFSNLDSVLQFSWSIDSTLADTSNSVEVRLIGLDENLVETTLFASTAYEGDHMLSSYSTSEVVSYRIDVTQQDDLNRRALPVRELQIIGKESVELAYDPNFSQSFSNEIIQPLDSFSFSIGIKNVSPSPIDSFDLNLFEIERGFDYVSRSNFGSLNPWESKSWSETVYLGNGPADRLVAFSISNLGESRERVETNNLAISPIELLGDAVNPRLRLFVDGTPILKEMLVSPEPIIELDILDNVGIDTSQSPESYVQLSLISPSGTVYVSNQNLLGAFEIIQPLSNGRMKIQYSPGQLTHGVWELSAVVLDAFNNSSVETPISYWLEVDTTASISSFLPYPNPAVDRVFFTYELTGEVPVDYQVDIYTSSGRIVRSLGPQDLGVLKIGRQLTSGFWDTTDTFGNRLARGVYLYRMSAAASNLVQGFEHRSSEIDSFVNSGFGKLVLLR